MDVSVVVPTLNEERVIGRLIKAVKAQEFEGKVEVIVADGVSKDKTVSIAKKLGARVVKEHTRTIAAGRQAGAEIAKGRIIIYTDADAVPNRQWVKSYAKAFEDKKVAGAFGWIVPHHAGALEMFFLKYSALVGGYVSNILGMDWVAGSNLAIRKRVFEKIGGMDVYLTTGEDTDLIKRARKEGKVVFVPSAKIKYSMRRIRGWGYLKYFSFHTKNFFYSHFLGRPAKVYEAVRKKA